MKTPRISTLGIASAFLFFTFFLGVRSVSAATITVDVLTNTGGAGCELREAIFSANTDTAVGGCTAGTAGTDSIVFSGSGTVDISNQDLPNITSQINMDGGSDIIVNAFNTSTRRIFTLSGTTSTTFGLSNIALMNGSSTNGGCISMEDAPGRGMTLLNVDFTWCTAIGNGGAVYVPTGNGGSVEMLDVTFTSSSALGQGGGLWAGSGVNVAVQDIVAFKNRANLDGGAFYVTSSALTVSPGTLSIASSTFTSNTSTIRSGGAVFSGKLMNTVASSTFVNNTAGTTDFVGGGALVFFRDFTTAQVNISTSVFRGNSSNSDGGAIFFYRTFNTTSGYGVIATISDSVFDANRSKWGAALGLNMSTSTPSLITRSLFSQNVATNSTGDIIEQMAGVVTYTNNTFEGNRSATAALTALGVDGVRMDLFSNTFYNNVSSSTSQGGLGGAFGGFHPFGGTQDQTIVRYANNIFEANAGAGGPSACENNTGQPATFISLGTNFFSEAPDATCTTVASDIIGGTAQLGSLQNNGGYTLSRVPAQNSVVINAANATYAPALDQRGFTRPQGAGYDIGSTDIADLTAPILAEVAPISTPQSDLTPDFSFTTNQAGTISYPGTCSSVTNQATSGTNVITFNLNSGTRYDNCQVRVTDSSGNGTTLTLTAFETTGTPGGSGGTSSGGGGLGSSGSQSLPPVTTTFQTNLQNLQNQGVSVHGLIKIPDNSAVYYVGSDGKRHAFPNDKVYFTWYENFDGVQLVNEAQMSSIPLGKNVTYKPGKKMVKFTTDNKVYAVAKGGILRWITTEEAAIALYGSSWNTNIDDISDAFYTNYTFGNNVSVLSDFNPAAVQASVSFPSDSLEM